MTIQVRNGAGGLATISTIDDLMLIAATAEGQEALQTAVEEITAKLPTGGATAAKQDALSALLTTMAVKDDDGAPFNPEALPQTLVYSSGVLQSVSVTDGADTWVQTFTYTDADLTGVSAWVKQ